MEKYIGTKVVYATPAWRVDGKVYLKDEAVPRSMNREDGYKVVYEGGYESWSPKDVFEKAEECWQEMLKHQPFRWIFSRKTGVTYLIRCIDDNHVFTTIQYSFDSAFKDFVFTDLVPFGVKVEE